jgi:hypothetical protein
MIMNKYKYLFLSYFFSFCILSCSNEKLEYEYNNNTSEFNIDNERFSLIVDNNTLIFCNLEDLYQCTDYLNEIGEQNFDAFEESIGFYSYRRALSDSPIESSYPNELISTLFNPDNKIIIGNSIFEISNNKDSVLVYENVISHDNCYNANNDHKTKFSVKNIIDVSHNSVSYYKSVNTTYCGQKIISAPIVDFSRPITIKAGNYDWVFWNVLEATISKGFWNGPFLIGLGTNQNCFAKTKNGCDPNFILNWKEGNGASYTISKSTSPLIAYRFDVHFFVYDNTPPAYGHGYDIIVDCKPMDNCQ